MSKTLDNIQLQALLPYNINSNNNVDALLRTIGDELVGISGEIEKLLFYPNISELPEPIIDLLAEQFQVAFYDVLGLDLQTKRQLVQNSIVWNKRKGTKAVMQEMLSTLYNSNAIVQEWFEYGGEPYHFRVYIENIKLSQGDLETVLYIINELKNVRSWLDNILINLTIKGNVYAGAVLKVHRKQKVMAGGV